MMRTPASILSSALLLAACTAPESAERASFATYREALAETAPGGAALLESGSAAEREAIERYRAFYRTYSADVVHEKVREVYAEDAFFRDPFREVRGIDAVEEYLAHGAELLGVAHIDVVDVASRGGEVYLRWVARVPTEDADEPPDETIGLSHVRFDRSGKVVFQQDYLDAGRAVYEKLPVIGWILYRIRSRI